jgi:hypothetical protein
MVTILLNVDQVVQYVDAAGNQAKADESRYGSQGQGQVQQFAVEYQPNQNETVLRPLFGPHGSQQVQQALA